MHLKQLKTISLFLLLATLAAACLPADLFPPPTAALPSSSTAPTQSWYALYFTRPDDPQSLSLSNGPDSALAAAIDQARLSVDVAIYDFNLWSLRQALLAAHQRGVAVRLVVESDNLDRDEVQELIQAGIPVLGDRRQALMHNKFVIIDRYEVWTGSMNFTLNGAYNNDNHLVRIRATQLAEDYLAEFEEMFIADQFGPTSPANTPNPSFSIEGALIEVYFSPEDDTLDRLVELVDGAQTSVYFLAYSFTSDPLADALIAAAARGVDVAGVFETAQASGQGGEFFRLADLGLDVELDGNPRNMHHKVLIVDFETVVLGSYNFSASAEERNDENTLIIHHQDLAAQFLDEFNRIYQLALLTD